MSSAVIQAADLLFPADGSGRTLNVKIFPSRPGVTADDLARQIIFADEQIASGRARLVTDVDGDID